MSETDYNRLAQEARASAINPFSQSIRTALDGTSPNEVMVQQKGCGPGVYDISVIGAAALDDTQSVVLRYKTPTETGDYTAAQMLPAADVAFPGAVMPATAKDRQIIVPAGYRLFAQALFACTVYLTKCFPGHTEGVASLPQS